MSPGTDVAMLESVELVPEMKELPKTTPFRAGNDHLCEPENL